MDDLREVNAVSTIGILNVTAENAKLILKASINKLDANVMWQYANTMKPDLIGRTCI
jgi:hypothetical protein